MSLIDTVTNALNAAIKPDTHHTTRDLATAVVAAVHGELFKAWNEGYRAAEQYRTECEENRRVIERLGIDELVAGLNLYRQPANPYPSLEDWDI